jgi:hypothetical protein
LAWKLANPAHRNSFIFWQLIGIADLVNAVGLGTTARLLSPDSASMAAMTVLPLSLVPTFLVPMFLVLHLICIAQAWAWKSAPSDTAPNEDRRMRYVAIWHNIAIDFHAPAATGSASNTCRTARGER